MTSARATGSLSTDKRPARGCAEATPEGGEWRRSQVRPNASAARIAAHHDHPKILLRFRNARSAVPAEAHKLDHLPVRGEAGAGGRVLQQTVELHVLDLVAASALLAQEQRAMMGVTEMLAGRIGVAALDLVDEAVLEKKIEGAIDGRRRDRLAFAPRKLVDDRIGPKRA